MRAFIRQANNLTCHVRAWSLVVVLLLTMKCCICRALFCIRSVFRCTLIAVFVFAACGNCGCESPVFQHPVGRTLSGDELQPIAGTWRSTDGFFQILVARDELILGTLKYNPKSKSFLAENAKAVLTRIAGETYGFICLEASNMYFLFLIEEYTEDKISLRYPDDDIYAKLIADRKLSVDKARNNSLFYPSVIVKADCRVEKRQFWGDCG